MIDNERGNKTTDDTTMIKTISSLRERLFGLMKQGSILGSKAVAIGAGVLSLPFVLK